MGYSPWCHKRVRHYLVTKQQRRLKNDGGGGGAVVAGVIETVSLRRWYLRLPEKVREMPSVSGGKLSKQEQQVQRP